MVDEIIPDMRMMEHGPTSWHYKEGTIRRVDGTHAKCGASLYSELTTNSNPIRKYSYDNAAGIQM